MAEFKSEINAKDIPPQNIEAEELILGAILLDPEAVGKVIDLVNSEVFYVQAHRLIYRAAVELHSQGNPTDFITIASWLEDNNLLDKIGGTTKLTQLLDRTVSAVNIERYVPLITEKYVRRQLISSGHEITDLAYDTTRDLDSVLDESEQKIFSLTQKRPTQGLVPISETIIHAYEQIEKLHLKLALPGISSGFYDLDAMTSGFQRSDLIIVAGRPSMGKCLAGHSEIVLQDGSIATIEEIYHRRQAKLLTLKNDWKFALTQPSDFINDGTKPVFRVTTKLGRYIETTLTHPYLTPQGWQKLSELKLGEKIAVPHQINIFGTETLPDYQVKLLAYLMGDRALRSISLQFTNNNPLLQEDFIQSVTNFKGVKVRCKTSQGTRNKTFYVTGDLGCIRRLLEKLELWGEDTHQKKIPLVIFRLQPPLLALFLNRLFANDGWASILKSGQVQLGYATASEKLVYQIQHLLLRFGIISNLKKRYVKYNGHPRLGWQLDITDANSIKIFIEEIGIFGKEKSIDLAREAIANNRYQTNWDLIPVEIWEQITFSQGSESWISLAKRSTIKDCGNIPVGKQALSRERLFQLALASDNLSLQYLATSEVYWDEIVSIEYIGEQQVYDLTIPETHNFIANDICVHNTSFALNIAANIAKEQKLPVAIFSLEMSKEQLAQRLLASEAKIESNRLRSGRFAQNDIERLVQAVATLSELPIHIDDTANLTVMQMRSEVRRLQSNNKGEIGLVLLDYLQLMEGSNSDNRVQELSKITRSLKGLARELNIPIIALSQLSRGVEQRTNKRPMLSDLRESGSIEQDADLVIMLYRDEYYSPETPDRGVAEVIIAKHRNGPTGHVKLLFDSEVTKFLNLQQKRDY
jgi:replicative DNA helicase